MTKSPVARAKLPQWWLDNTPHDTLEEQVERRRIEQEEKLAELEENEDEDNVIICGDTDHDGIGTDNETPLESLPLNGHTNGTDVDSENGKRQNGYKRSTAPRSAPITPEEFECTDYKVERSKLKPVELEEKTKNITISTTNSMRSSIKSPLSTNTVYSQDVNSPAALPESAPTVSPEPMSTNSNNTLHSDSLNASRKPRKFKTAFTGVSPFDFAMQQRAREQERREKERLARESLSRHHAETVEYDRVSEQNKKTLEEKRQKKEAEENIKKFRKDTLDSDLATELKRRQLEEKRKKKEAYEQHHGYKSTS